MRTRLLLCLAACVTALGVAAGSSRLQAQPQAGSAAPTGALHGHIRLSGPATANPRIRMGLDPLCARANRAGRPVQEIVLKGADGGLANAFVALEGSFPDTPIPTAPAVITQRNCLYTPRVIGARVGQTLRFINGDTLLHNLHSQSRRGNDFNETQPRSDMVFNYTLKNGEVMLRVTCDVHSWMWAYVGVVDHPYYDVSAPDGAFSMPRVPVGKQTIAVWHERYGRLVQTVDITPGATTTIDFAYTGSERPAASLRELRLPGDVAAVTLLAGR